jgi:outer membrane receptor protein involved in Fe transport
LRGPQSTLFGKNASAGVISVITAKPDLDETNGSASVTVGDYSQYIVKADVNGPLSDTVAFGLSGNYNRRDGYYDNLAGGDALGELNRYGVRGDLYFVPSDALEARVIADYSKLDEACCGVANLLNGPSGGAILALGGNLVPNAPFAYEGYYNYTPTNEFENSGISAQFDYDINDAVTLTSITSFRNLQRFDNADSDFTSAMLISETSGNTTDLEIDTITQELRLTGSTDTMGWMVGGYYFNEDVKQDTAIALGPAFRTYGDILATNAAGGTPFVDPSPLSELETALGIPAGTFYAAEAGLFEASTMDNEAFSIFAQVDIDMGDRATLTLGANYTEDEKNVTYTSTQTEVFSTVDLIQVGFGGAFAQITGLPPTPANIAANPGAAAAAQGISVTDCTAVPAGTPCNALIAFQPFQFLPPNISFPNAIEPGKTKDDATTWTVRLAFDVSDDVNVYASAGTGFKASSWNLSRDSRVFPEDLAAIQALNPTVNNLVAGTRFAEPEESTVLELGMKARWDTVALNVALFDQEIDDFQSNTFVGTGFVLVNAGKQSTRGLELDVRWVPTENFEGTVAATLLDPKYDSFTQAACVPPPGSASANFTCDLSGETPAGIHEVSIVTTGTYNFTIGNATAFIRGEYVYEDDIQVIDNVPADIASREVSTLNASFGLAWENGFEAMLWGRNVTNDEYLLSAFPTTVQVGSYSGYPNQPRTFGVTVRKYFD